MIFPNANRLFNCKVRSSVCLCMRGCDGVGMCEMKKKINIIIISMLHWGCDSKFATKINHDRSSPDIHRFHLHLIHASLQIRRDYHWYLVESDLHKIF